MTYTAQDLYQFIDSLAPFSTQEDWDNSGFLVGDQNKEIHKVALCLDVTLDTLRQAKEFGADLVVSHHPVIFHPLKAVTADSPVFYAIENGIGLLAAHTPWDAADGGVNDVLATVLGLTDIHKIGPEENGVQMLRAGRLKTAVPAAEFADIVATALNTVVRVSSATKQIQTVAVCGGAGCSFLPALASEGNIDAFVTGDAKHNDFLDAIDLDIALLAAGHYETETISVPVLLKLLQQEFPELDYRYLESAPVAYIG